MGKCPHSNGTSRSACVSWLQKKGDSIDAERSNVVNARGFEADIKWGLKLLLARRDICQRCDSMLQRFPNSKRERVWLLPFF